MQHSRKTTSWTIKRRVIEGNWLWISWLSLISFHREFRCRSDGWVQRHSIIEKRLPPNCDMWRILRFWRHFVRINRSRWKVHGWVTRSLLIEHIIAINSSSISDSLHPRLLNHADIWGPAINQIFWKQMKFCFCFVYLWTPHCRWILRFLHRHLSNLSLPHEKHRNVVFQWMLK